MATSRGEAKGDEEAVEGEKGDQPARKASGCGGSGGRLASVPVAGFCFPREVAETGRRSQRGDDAGRLGPPGSEQIGQLT